MGFSIHLSRKAAIVCSLKCANSNSSLVRLIRSLAAVWLSCQAIIGISVLAGCCSGFCNILFTACPILNP